MLELKFRFRKEKLPLKMGHFEQFCTILAS